MSESYIVYISDYFSVYPTGSNRIPKWQCDHAKTAWQSPGSLLLF